MQNCGKEVLITMFKDSSLPFGIIRVELDETGHPADWIFLCCNQALEALTGGDPGGAAEQQLPEAAPGWRKRVDRTVLCGGL